VEALLIHQVVVTGRLMGEMTVVVVVTAAAAVATAVVIMAAMPAPSRVTVTR
jgi:hypothetical protein